MGAAALEIERVSKRYGDVVALEDLTLRVWASEVRWDGGQQLSHGNAQRVRLAAAGAPVIFSSHELLREVVAGDLR